MCFKCGTRKHVLNKCISESKPRRCSACSCFSHICKNCHSCQFKQQLLHSQFQFQTPNLKSLIVVESLGVGASKLFTIAIIEAVYVCATKLDTGLAFLMLCTLLNSQLPNKFLILYFKNKAFNIVGVGGASAKVKSFIDVQIQLAGVTVAHNLLVFENLSFSILLGNDILRVNSATIFLGDAFLFEIKAQVGDICFKQQTELVCEFKSSPLIFCTTETITICPVQLLWLES